MASKKNLFVRNPNIPVLAWTVGRTLHEILIAGPGEYINMVYKSHGRWSDNSLITREYSPSGLKESEENLYSPNTWGWLSRYISGEIQAQLNAEQAVKVLTPSDTHHSSVDEGVNEVGFIWRVFFDLKGLVVLDTSSKWKYQYVMRLPPGVTHESIVGKTYAEVEELYFAHYKALRAKTSKVDTSV